MDVQQIMEMLKAMQEKADANQAEIKAERKADREQMLIEMKADRTKDREQMQPK
jgi:hypothetical protein